MALMRAWHRVALLLSDVVFSRLAWSQHLAKVATVDRVASGDKVGKNHDISGF